MSTDHDLQIPELHPIEDRDLDGVCRFLQANLNPKVSLEEWMRAYRHPWDPEKPNNGFMLRYQERIVGVFMAIYSRQTIRGHVEPFCNPNSWVVERDFRKYSNLLYRALLAQKAYHFFITTPNPVVAKIFSRSNFQYMPDQITVLPCVPLRWSSGRIIDNGRDFENFLDATSYQIFNDHRDIPWLHHVAAGSPEHYVYMIFKRVRLKRMNSIRILHVSNPDHFLDYRHLLAIHFFRRYFAITMQIDRRFLSQTPLVSLNRQDGQPKMYFSDHLGAADFGYIYSESTALDQ
ncbi:MAG: hypothetical protein HQL84_02480 [Magnetococcales bacterium]|nr:hypothetical protein [Magnetococcales bacterium]MBF0148892.1 hypothetical protein [Magnetococcales bacterium]MBF0172952.1 hypothetical protein [Magnetococcales bacterium]MBF0347340.1 hypothetical protein [Magnetococcales bacterium]MBF0630093.1 hypothetical protein [Magnetococcales bacterium]